jgi:hypothetical protein
MATSDPNLRASDAERDQVVDQLRQHVADGRLTMDEFEQRVAEALAAKTLAELGPVLRELPPLPPAPQTEQPLRRRMPLPGARTLVAAVAVVFAVVMITQGVWWIVFPLMGIFGGCGQKRACSTTYGRHSATYGRHHRRADTEVPDERELIRV